MKTPLVFALAIPLLFASCEFDDSEDNGPVRTDQVSIPLGTADRANVELDMAAGGLTLRSGAEQLLQGRFEYNRAAWKPEVHTSKVGSQVALTIREPDRTHMGGRRHYLWDLALNNKVLLDLTLNCGAGQATLNLGNLDLRSVTVHMGAGQVDLDLRGHPSRDYDVNVSGGVGQATINLPQGVGIRAEAHGGLGSITVTGLEKQGDAWVNNLYDNAKANVRLTVNGGIGEIRIVG